MAEGKQGDKNKEGKQGGGGKSGGGSGAKGAGGRGSGGGASRAPESTLVRDADGGFRLTDAGERLLASGDEKFLGLLGRMQEAGALSASGSAAFRKVTEKTGDTVSDEEEQSPQPVATSTHAEKEPPT